LLTFYFAKIIYLYEYICKIVTIFSSYKHFLTQYGQKMTVFCVLFMQNGQNYTHIFATGLSEAPKTTKKRRMKVTGFHSPFDKLSGKPAETI